MRRSLRGKLVRPWVAHLLLVVPALLLLGSVSTPGILIFVALLAAALLLAAAVGWLAWVVALRSRRRWSRWIPVAPLGAVLVLGLIVADVPLHARWGASRDAFAAQVASLPPGPDAVDAWVRLAVPARLGLYRVTSAYRVPGGVVFYEANGAVTDDAGFAYLPGGLSPALESGSFENPQFRHLDGPWYAWTASW